MLKVSINGVQRILSAHKFKRVSNYTTVAAKASEIPNSMVDYLVNSLGFSKEEASVTSSKVLINAVKKSPRLLGPSMNKGVLDVVSLLQSYGLSDHQIKLFAWRQSRYLSLGTKSLEAVLIRVENLGIPHGSGMFLRGICALCSISEAGLDARKRIYKSYGFNDEDVLTLARKNPRALIVSESKLRNGLDFFMKEAGYLPSEIAIVPFMLTLSLEKRVIPRYRVWKGLKKRGIEKVKVTNKKLKKINVAFVSCLKFSEPQFFEKFVQPFKEECHDLYSDYVKVARPVLF